MQETTAYWKQINQSSFMPKADVIIDIYRTDEVVTRVQGSSLISFSHVKNGDPLCSIITQDKIVFTTNDIDGADFDFEPDNDVYTNAKCVVTEEGFLKPDSTTDGILGGTFYISEVKPLNNGNRYQFTAQTITAFMTEKAGQLVANQDKAYYTLEEVINQALASKAVPWEYDVFERVVVCDRDQLLGIDVTYIEGTNNYSLAEVMQLIAAMSGSILYVDREGKIHIEKPGETTEDYVLSSRTMYKPVTIEYAPKIGNVAIVYNNGSGGIGTGYEGDKIGAEQIVTIPIMLGDDSPIGIQYELCHEIYDKIITGRKRFSMTARFDPALDIFDVIAIPYKDRVYPAIITGINAVYNGAWRADIKAMVVDAEIDLSQDTMQLLTAEQIESITEEEEET